MDVLQEFEAYLRNQGRSANTIEGYCKDNKRFILWFERTKQQPFTLRAVTPTDVIEYCQMEGIKSTTANRRLAALSAFMRWATDTDLIEQDPTQNCKRMYQPKQQSKFVPVKYLNKEQQLVLLKAIEHRVKMARLHLLSYQRDASFVIFLLHTGLRLHEAMYLRMEDLTLSEQEGQVIVRRGAGRFRKVLLNTEACKALQAWLSVRPSISNKYIWVAVDGNGEETVKALSDRYIQSVLWRMAPEADLPRLTSGMLRHTFAKNLVDSGVSLEKVAELLGVSMPTTPKLPDNDLEQSIEQLAQT